MFRKIFQSFHIDENEERHYTYKPLSLNFAYIHLVGISYPSHMAACNLNAIDSVTCGVRALQMTYGFSTRLTYANKTPAFKVNK